MGRMEDIQELLDDARRGIQEIERMHQESLDAEKIVPGMRARIKSVLEHQRSTLDYLVSEINARYCTKPPEKAYYPLAWKPSKFDATFDKNLPGVRASNPEIAEAFARYQPDYRPNEWIKFLWVLVNPNKHNALTLQTQESTETLESQNGPHKIIIHGELTFVTPDASPTRDPTGFLGPEPWTRGSVTEWIFMEPREPVLTVLALIQQGVEKAFADIRQAAGL